MGFNRTPHYRPGLLLVGDAGGMVNPFNGEGIAYAMESASIAAACAIQSLARSGSAAEHALQNYPIAIREALGSYYRIGNLFSKAIGNPTVMRLATRHGLPRKTLMAFLLKLLANLHDPKGGDASDRLIAAMTRLTPAVK
jgi:flavin-dependent dehydrogenase